MKKGMKKVEVKGNEFTKASEIIMSVGVALKVAIDTIEGTDPNDWYEAYSQAKDGLESALLGLQIMYQQYPVVFSLMKVYTPVGVQIVAERNPYYDPDAAKDSEESNDDDDSGVDPFPF